MEKSTENSLVMTILDLSSYFLKKGDTIAGREGLTVHQWLILLFLKGDPNMPDYHRHNLESKTGLLAKDIAEVLGVSRPNITHMVSALLKKGLVIQKEEEGDRRRKRIQLTSKAIELLQDLEPLRHRFNQMFFSFLTEQERKDLLAILNQGLTRMHHSSEVGLKENS